MQHILPSQEDIDITIQQKRKKHYSSARHKSFQDLSRHKFKEEDPLVTASNKYVVGKHNQLRKINWTEHDNNWNKRKRNVKQKANLRKNNDNDFDFDWEESEKMINKKNKKKRKKENELYNKALCEEAKQIADKEYEELEEKKKEDMEKIDKEMEDLYKKRDEKHVEDCDKEKEELYGINYDLKQLFELYHEMRNEQIIDYGEDIPTSSEDDDESDDEDDDESDED